MRLIDADALIGSLHNHAFLEGDDRYIVYNVIQKQPTVGGWISVKNRLPEVGQKVLTYSKYGHVSDRTLERHGGQNGYDVLLFSPDGMKPGTDITYWMPLPEQPEELKHEL